MGQYYMPISIEKKEFVLSHDYGNGLKLMEHSWIGNAFVGVVENLIKKGGQWYNNHILWAGDYADDEKEQERNYYGIVSETGTKLMPVQNKDTNLRYLVNFDKKEFVDLKKVPVSDVWTDENGNEYNFNIHPLPLLTCEGNGRGGGDYRGESPLIGKWARDRVTIRKTKPKNKKYKELIFDLTECNNKGFFFV